MIDWIEWASEHGYPGCKRCGGAGVIERMSSQRGNILPHVIERTMCGCAWYVYDFKRNRANPAKRLDPRRLP